MHDYPGLIFTALLIFVFGLFSRLSERSLVTGPMIFVAVGVMVSPLGLDLLKVSMEAKGAKLAAEITLVIILFVDASMIHFTKLRETLAGVPARLLALGLPMTMVLGALVARLLFPQMDLWLVIMMALILSPTDAALGQAVIKSENVPLSIREAISIESGLNDGIALPPILVCIAVLSIGAETIDGSGHWLYFTALQLGLGPLVGAAVGWFGGRLVDEAAGRGWMEPTFQRLAAISLALLAYAAAESVHGNGFIAAFFAGLLLGTKTPVVRERIQEFGEAEGQLLSLSIFLLLGLVMVPATAPYWDGATWLYAILSLTLIRMLPVVLALMGSGLDKFSVGFIGWFGPRGIASVLYLLIVIGELGVEGYEQALAVIVLTVLLSTFAHGISAVPMVKLFKSEG